MNRRSFFSRVAVVAAVPAFVQAAELATSASITPTTLSAAPPDAPTVIAVTSPGVETVSPVRPVERDLLTLRLERGLMAPCPNCGETRWKAFGTGERVRCEECDWQDHVRLFAQHCRCQQCHGGFGGGHLWVHDPYPVVERRDLHHDARPGIYNVAERGQLLTRTVLNGYDVTQDRTIHHVVEKMMGRVDCAIALATGHKFLGGSLFVESWQPSGDRVLLGWHVADCYEWQVERGEKPAILYQRDANGRTTLVQGVVR